MDNYGKYSPVTSQEQYQVCCITMNMNDRLRLLACPSEIIPLVRESILQIWGKIQNERPYYGSHEFQLKGYPWIGSGPDSVAARRVITAILSLMAQNGWNLLQSSDVSKKEKDVDSLFFERGNEDKDVSIFAVSFNMGDKIRLIEAPAFMPYLKQAVEKFWPSGIQKERDYHKSLELKLSGYPWLPTGQDAVHSKLMLAQIIANFRSVGYKLYASVDISHGTFSSSDHVAMGGLPHGGKDTMESWFFRKVGQNWQ